jgi:hypothetical protein
MNCQPCSDAFASIVHPGDNSNAWQVTVDVSNNINLVVLELVQALPVRWLSFVATPAARHVALDWRTEAETDNRGFRVQRSSDAKTWTDLDFVAGRGDRDQPTDYRYRDASPLPGVSYYRLQQEDWDGTTDYSAIREVEFRATATTAVFPNPFRDELWVQLPVDKAASATLRLYDAAGRLVWIRTQVPLSAAEYRLDTGRLPAGSYTLQLETPAGRESLRVVKLR